MLFSAIGLSLLTSQSALANTTNQNDWLVPTSILTKVPTDKATVGVIPYYVQDHQVFILLGRERIDGTRSERAGKYSDFGGSIELDGTNFAQNAIRELKEETIGQITITQQDILEKGILLQKLSAKGREIFYIFYPMSDVEYKQTRELGKLWHTLCTPNIDPPQCEKDQFTWVSLQDINNKAKQIRDIDNNLHTLHLREFFVQDCLNHPDFAKLAEHLSALYAPSMRISMK